MIKDSLTSTQRIKIDVELPLPTQLQAGLEYKLPVVISNPSPAPLHLINGSNAVSCSGMFCINGKWTMVNAKIIPAFQRFSGNASYQASVTFTAPDIPEGTYNFGIGLRTPLLLEGFNSSFNTIEIVRWPLPSRPHNN